MKPQLWFTRYLKGVALLACISLTNCDAFDAFNPWAEDPTDEEVKTCVEGATFHFFYLYHLCVNNSSLPAGTDCFGQAFFSLGTGLILLNCDSPGQGNAF